MILVDTNVVSELMSPQTDSAVRIWIARMAVEDLFLASTSLAELLFGIAILPAGRRKSYLSVTLEDIVANLFEGRIVVFDRAAAVAYSELVSRARLKGRAIQVADGQIASVAAVHGFTVATRDKSPFEAAGLTVINPWEA